MDSNKIWVKILGFKSYTDIVISYLYRSHTHLSWKVWLGRWCWCGLGSIQGLRFDGLIIVKSLARGDVKFAYKLKWRESFIIAISKQSCTLTIIIFIDILYLWLKLTRFGEDFGAATTPAAVLEESRGAWRAWAWALFVCIKWVDYLVGFVKTKPNHLLN